MQRISEPQRNPHALYTNALRCRRQSRGNINREAAADALKWPDFFALSPTDLHAHSPPPSLKLIAPCRAADHPQPPLSLQRPRAPISAGAMTSSKRTAPRWSRASARSAKPRAAIPATGARSPAQRDLPQGEAGAAAGGAAGRRLADRRAGEGQRDHLKARRRPACAPERPGPSAATPSLLGSAECVAVRSRPQRLVAAPRR